MSRLQAALLGGLFIGVVSGLPIVGAANACCCLWVVSGGVLTTYLGQQGLTTALAPAEAALSGLVAGIVGAVLMIGLSMALFLASGSSFEGIVRQTLELYPEAPADVQDRALAFAAGPAPALVMAFVMVPTYAIVSMVGSLLALLFFRTPSAPAAQA